jgi:hypothetical protein
MALLLRDTDHAAGSEPVECPEHDIGEGGELLNAKACQGAGGGKLSFRRGLRHVTFSHDRRLAGPGSNRGTKFY